MKYYISLRTTLACLIAFGLFATTYSQTATKNYITTYSPRVPRTDEMTVPTLPKDSCIKTVQYFDGFGRPDQAIQVALSPLGKDIVQPIEYDQYGREAKKYLPYRGSNSNGNYVTTDLTEQSSYYLGQFTSPDNGYPYAETVFDNSPLNRVMMQGAPGYAWQPAQHPVRYAYSTNITNDVRLWTVNTNNSISTSGFYLPGKLYKTVIKDENWTPVLCPDSLLRTTEEYKDLQGNVVLKRSYVKVGTTVTPVETYYVYDDFSLLRYVLPPEAVKNRGTLTTLYPYTPLVKNLCYYYQYDARKRLIIKQLPGAGQVHLAYDNRDRLIASQDSVQRVASKWLVTKYDHLNRPVLTALKSLSDSRSTLQTYLDAYVSPSIFFESRTTTGVGYTLSNSFATKFTLTEPDLLSVTYYDTYGYPGTKVFDNTVRVSNYYNSTTGKYYCEQTRSLVTGSRVKVLDGTEHNSSGFRWLVSTVYYDDKYRPIQTLRDLYSTVTTDNEILSTQYDFTGKTTKTLARQVFRGNTNSVTETYLYDHADRLTQIKHKLNTGTEITLASMEYNDLGQLKRKALHGQIGAGIQDLNYAYNIRGWLDSINNPATNPSSTSFKKLNLGLYYDTVPAGLSVSPQYNGNISAMVWNTPSRLETLSPAFKQGYGFTYDPLNRLTASVYGENTNFTTSPGANNTSYAYDLNGNIKSLSRYRKGTGLIDNLTYTYKFSNLSNLLDKVEDASGTNGFVNGANTTNEYSFDGNGNLIADLNKGYTSILYNYLNLPKRVGTTTAGQYISYIYDAAGSKLAKISTTGAYTYYAGGFVYSGSSLTYIIHEEGHLEPSGAYKYYLKDHLGSVRLVVNTTGTGGTVEQQTDYYPFGMTIAEYNGSIIDYRYNGKELQDDLINSKKLDWYDYGARFYDPQIGRWHVADPKGEQYYSNSPYHFCANNPLIFVDPDGQSYYYGSDGSFLFETCDDKDDVYYWNNDKENKRQNEDGENETYYGGFDALQHNGNTVQNGDLMLLASTAYGESSEKNVSNEVYGIASAIVNNMDLRKNGTIQGTIKGFAFAATDGNKRTKEFNNTSEGGRNGTFMQTAIGGAINALSGGIDYSNGATHWAGTDIASSTEKRATGGLLFSDQSHDMFCLGSQTANGAPVKGYNRDGSYRGTYSYTWQTTAAFGGTTFMKKTDKFIIATGAPRY